MDIPQQDFTGCYNLWFVTMSTIFIMMTIIETIDYKNKQKQYNMENKRYKYGEKKHPL